MEREHNIKKHIKTNCLQLWPEVFPNNRIVDWIMENFWDEENPLKEADVYSLIDECRQELIQCQEAWPSVTDCDRLDNVVASLDKRDVLFVQHIDTTPSSCWSEIFAAIQAKPDGERYIGAAYYHFQSTERALAYGKMHIYFGITESGTEETTALSYLSLTLHRLQEKKRGLVT